MRPHAVFPILALALLAGGQVALAAPQAMTSIVVDGSHLSSDVPALVSGNHVLVPLRGVFEQFGALVTFDEASGVAIATLGSTTVRITVGSDRARVNGRPATMDVAAREFAGRVMIPLRFVAQALGVAVDYDAASNTVVIVSGRRPGNFAAYAGGPVYTNVARLAPTVQSVRPESGTIVGSQYPSIYARFEGGSSAVDPATVQVLVDGQDVTDQSTVSSAYVSYTPMQALSSGAHDVEVMGRSADGTPFQENWTFRVDAGSASDYTVGSYGGGAGFGSPAFGFGWPWFNRFGFSPPGFSLFTPGPLFFVSGNFIEVVLISRFFPFGGGFFTISGIPGQCAFTPWLGHPGMFWGAVQVPAGVVMSNAVIKAHFTLPNGRHVAIDSTAPLQIQGQRHSLPADLHYAVMPHLTNQPRSLGQAVVFDRLQPRKSGGFGATQIVTGAQEQPRAGALHPSRIDFGMHEPASMHDPFGMRMPVMPRTPVMVRQPLEPVRPVQPMPVFRSALPQWGMFGQGGVHPVGAGIKPPH